MADLSPTPATSRSARQNAPGRPRWAFWKGLVVGAAVEVPVVAAAVWLVARLGVGDPSVPYMRLLRFTALFCGAAALLTAGGIGRLAASVAVERGRRRAIYVAARAHAVAGAGLVLIATIPHGSLPDRGWGWAVPPAVGLAAGALCGALVGVVCSRPRTIRMAALTRRPTEALRQLLDPEDLVRLGSALRARTSTLFEGIFEPAAPPPAEPAPEAAAPPPSPPPPAPEVAAPAPEAEKP